MDRPVNPRELLLATLAGRPHDGVAFQEMEVSAHVVDAVLGTHHGVWSMELPAEDYVEFTCRSNQCALYCNALWKAGRIYRQTSEGRLVYVDGFVKSPSDIKRIEPWDWQESVARIQELSSEARARDLAVMVAITPPYKLAKAAMGYQDFLLRLCDDPDFVLKLMDWFEEQYVEPSEHLLDAGADVLMIPGDLCTGSGPMISPDMARRFWLPTTKRLVELAVSRGIPVIMHMDGDFSAVVDMMLELPVAALHPFEPCGVLDIFKFHEEHGDRLTVWGNINLAGVLTRGTPQEVAADAREHIERLALAGRYILGSSHDISPDVSVENFRAMVQASRSVG